ncbi:MAG: hypothetical protein QW057_07785 [Candidatus Bathyarchaeia archaeon]
MGATRVYTDGALWYPEACQRLGLEHGLCTPRLWFVLERAV